jgi:ornithine cyclodeaminase/alanine dehydrogenase-like protein (mu-crystallin family)
MASCIILSSREVYELLPMSECIELMSNVLASLARGELYQPLRSAIVPREAPTFMSLMPAYRWNEPLYVLKALVLSPENPKRGLDSHQGTVTLFDGVTGEVRAIMNASAITEIRTAAVSAVATRVLARSDAQELAILGAGVQARAHLTAMRAVHDFSRIRVYSPHRAHAEELGVQVSDSAEECVRGADVIVTATNSSIPVLQYDWLKPGAHLNVVGSSSPRSRELDASTVAATSMFVDWRESAVNESGEYAAALAERAIGGPRHIRGEIGEILIGRHAGRASDDEITVFKSLGLAIEDLAASEYVLHRASERDWGTSIDL